VVGVGRSRQYSFKIAVPPAEGTMLPATVVSLIALIAPDPAAPWEVVEACPLVKVIGLERATATAVVIGQKDGFAYLLTAHHAVADASPSDVHFYTRRSYPAVARVLRECKVVAKFPEADFALLKLDTEGTPVPELKLAPPAARPRKVPFAALSVGCSGANPPTGVDEKVGAKRFGRREGGETAFFWETAVMPKKGRSGGPLVADGKVIGICAAGKDNRGYYTHADELLAGLKAEGYGWLWSE
jgi:S1-C subfamily serine protease